MSEDDDVEEKTLMAVVLEMSERLGAMETKMSAVPHDRHNLEHEWIRVDMERKQAQRDFWIDIHKKLATTTIVGAFLLVGSAVTYAFTQWIINLKP